MSPTGEPMLIWWFRTARERAAQRDIPIEQAMRELLEEWGKGAEGG